MIGALTMHQTSIGAHQDGNKAKAPVWLHGMEVKVRKSGEANFSESTKKIGIEVFRDDNNGNLIYISESGDIAVIPAK